MDQKNQNQQKSDCGCSDTSCCQPSSGGGGKWKAIVFIIVIVAAMSLVGYKLLYKSEPAPTATTTGCKSDTTATGSQCAIKCAKTPGTKSCCPGGH